MALRIEIKVVPSSGKLNLTFDKQLKLKCYLKAPAQEGQANYELIKFIAKSCHVIQRDIEIIAGFTSKNKVLLISTNMTYEQFLQQVGLGQQATLF